MDVRSSSSVSSIITTTYNTISNRSHFPHVNKMNSSNFSKKYKIVYSSSSKGKKRMNSLLITKSNRKTNNNRINLFNSNPRIKPIKYNEYKEHIDVYDYNQNNNTNENFFPNNYLNTKSTFNFRTFYSRNKKPKDTSPQICSVYNFPESKNLFLFIPNSKFLKENKEFDTYLKKSDNSPEKLIQNLSIRQIEKKYSKFSLFHNVTIPYNYKIRMLLFNNMPKCFTDICERANIKYKKKPINSNIIWHLYDIYSMQQLIREIHQNQHYNHFPSTFALGRKDFMYKHYKKYRNLYKDDYNYVPETYILPDDANEFLDKYKNIISNLSTAKTKFIVKPVGLSRGRGIHILNNKSEFKSICKASEVRHGKNYLVSKYISKPHLINDKKYDLRIYVLITSLYPLKIYMYKEGLVRFATEEYIKGNYNNVYIHLTNYSINKENITRYNNNTNDEDYENFSKWSLSEYKEYFIKNNEIENYNNIMEKIKDIIIKTIITSTDDISADIALGKKNSLFELYGFDILVDNKFNVWLIEVNVGPSMKCSSPLDQMIKTNLISDIINVIGVKFYEHHEKDILFSLDKKDERIKINNRKINKFNLGGLKAEIFNGFDKNNLSFKGHEFNNEYFINGTLRDFKEENLRSSVTDFELIFPIKENIQYYGKFFSSNSNNVDNIVTWQYLLTH